VPAQTQDRAADVHLPADAVLANMWDYARDAQDGYDVLLNLAFDWLPFYLTPFLRRPVAHLLSMASQSDALDLAVTRVLEARPGSVAVHSGAQAATFPFSAACRVVGAGLDLDRYRFNPIPGPWLGWAGRISPEKGLEDAFEVAAATQSSLRVMGALQDPNYWTEVRTAYPSVAVEYLGFLPTQQLQTTLGECRCLLATPHWVEAFGLVAIEALACGTPVVAYDIGGPAEIVRHGETGWLVRPGDVAGLIRSVGKVHAIDRHACRQQAEAEYSLDAFGGRCESWLLDVAGELGGVSPYVTQPVPAPPRRGSR
jgi:UDP-glucose:tetrahydrobiopterin glucosyltransferase